MATVPDNARKISFIPTLKILAVGLLISAFVYYFLRYREAVVPKAIKGAMATKKWRLYKDEVLLRTAQVKGATLESFADGSPVASNPREFWDGILSLGDRRVALDVHTSSQNWPGLHGIEEEQNRYALQIHAMALQTQPTITDVAIVNSEPIWENSIPARFTTILRDLAQASGRPRYLFASGSPGAIAGEIQMFVQTQPK